jgi:hypothetical protein
VKASVFFLPLVLALIVLIAVLVWTPAGEPSPTDTGTGPEPVPTPTTTIQIEERVQGRTARQWHKVAARYLQSTRVLRHAIRFDPETTTAIGLACTVYGNCATLWRKASCESHLYRYAHNSSGASGLFQFLPGTWRSTPFGRFSIYDPYANALAAGWMHARGRGGEWVCR